jgi:hypothetical protein
MKSHIMTSMSSGYDPVVLKYRGELAETPLVKLRKEITLQYKTLLKTGANNKSESALVANVSKHPYKSSRVHAVTAERLDTRTTSAVPPRQSLQPAALMSNRLTRQM